MIEEFERLLSSGMCGNRQDHENVPKKIKQDEFFSLNFRNHVPSPFNNQCTMTIFWEGLQKCYDEYSSEYDILKEMPVKCTTAKMQKTNPGSGYHVWHCEQNAGEMANRALTYILYLNTLEQNCAGETEFLYQRLRVPPKSNSMVIWPASYTHTHRGNVVHGDKSKYIITGWFYLD